MRSVRTGRGGGSSRRARTRSRAGHAAYLRYGGGPDAAGTRRDPEGARPGDRPGAPAAGHRARHGARVEIADGIVSLEIVLTIAGCPLRHSFEEQVGGARRHPRRARRRPLLRRHDGRRAATADDEAAWRARGRTTTIRLSRDTRVIAVASGKGGVGKSSLSANLAVAFSSCGAARRAPRRRHLRPLDPAHARHPPEAGRSRRDDRARR